MKLINNSPRNYIAFETILEAGKTLEVEDKQIAKILLKQEGVEEFVDKEEVKKLKEELAKLKEAKKEEKPKKEEDKAAAEAKAKEEAKAKAEAKKEEKSKKQETK